MKQQTTFNTPYEQYRHLRGLPCQILGVADPVKYDYEPEHVGDMYLLRFDTGDEVLAWPEEIKAG